MLNTVKIRLSKNCTTYKLSFRKFVLRLFTKTLKNYVHNANTSCLLYSKYRNSFFFKDGGSSVLLCIAHLKPLACAWLDEQSNQAKLGVSYYSCTHKTGILTHGKAAVMVSKPVALTTTPVTSLLLKITS